MSSSASVQINVRGDTKQRSWTSCQSLSALASRRLLSFSTLLKRRAAGGRIRREESSTVSAASAPERQSRESRQRRQDRTKGEYNKGRFTLHCRHPQPLRIALRLRLEPTARRQKRTRSLPRHQLRGDTADAGGGQGHARGQPGN